jgi:hypothetical protein
LPSDDESSIVSWDKEDAHEKHNPPVFLEQLDVCEIQVAESSNRWDGMMSNHGKESHEILWPLFDQLWEDHRGKADPEDWYDDKVKTGCHFQKDHRWLLPEVKLCSFERSDVTEE